MTMLWYKSWLDTRWRFVIGFALCVCGAGLAVVGYPRVTRLIALAPAVDTTTEVGRRVRDIVELSRGFRGYIWAQWFRQSMVQSVTLLAILLGSGGVVTHGGGELYTLSLPVSREQLLYTRAAVGLAELLVIAFVPSLVIAAMSPAIGERYGVVSALVHATCLFITCGAFFSLALLLSTSYSDVWRPMLITAAVGLVLSLAEAVNPTVAQFGVYKLMSGETYFRLGRVPWPGLAAAGMVAAGLIAAAATNVSRRDY
jgi:hypothetical protein